MSTGVMYASTKSFWYPLGSGGGVAPGHGTGVVARAAPPRVDVAVTRTGRAGSASGTFQWYWYSPESSNRISSNEPVVPSTAVQVTVIPTSGSSAAVVAAWVCRNV